MTKDECPRVLFVQKLHPKKKPQGGWPVPHQGVTGTTDKTRGRGRLTPTPEWETRSEGSSFRTLPPPNGRTTKRRLPTLPWCLVNGRKRPETFPWSQHSAEPFLHQPSSKMLQKIWYFDKFSPFQIFWGMSGHLGEVVLTEGDFFSEKSLTYNPPFG